MDTCVRHIDLPDGKAHTISGTIVHRGAISRGASLTVLGELKIGRFSSIDAAEVRAAVDQNGEGGVLTATKGFPLPACATLCAERALDLRSEHFPKQGVFDCLTLVGAEIDLRGLPEVRARMLRIGAAEEELSDSARSTLPTRGTALRAGKLFGPNITIAPFASITAEHLRDFLHTRGCGLTANEISVGSMQECTMRAERVALGNAGGSLLIFPVNASLEEPPSFGSMFDPEHEDYRALCNFLWREISALRAQAHVCNRCDAPDGSEGELEMLEPPRDFDLCPADSEQLTGDQADYSRAMYDWVTGGLMGGFEPIGRSEVRIDRLDAVESSISMRGKAHSRVFVYRGDLSIGHLASRGVVINVPTGTVSIEESIFRPTACEPEYSTSIDAARIELTAAAAKHPDVLRMELRGPVFVEGIRTKELESNAETPKAD